MAVYNMSHLSGHTLYVRWKQNARGSTLELVSKPFDSWICDL